MSGVFEITENFRDKHDSMSSCSSNDEMSFRRASSSASMTTSTCCDQTDNKDKSPSKRKKVKVPWNVSSDSDVPRRTSKRKQVKEYLKDQLSFSYYSINALRHVFNLLDSKYKCNGMLAKSRLQVICATICMVYNLNHNANELAEFNGDKKEMSFDELINYFEAVIHSRVNMLTKMDQVKLEETAWKIVSQDRKEVVSQLFSEDELFKLWRIFNKLVSDDTSTIDIEEVELFLQGYMKAIGTVWDRAPLEDFTKKSRLTFWELVYCLETKYLSETPKSVFLEGLDTLMKIYIDEIIKVGMLTKKGHLVRSMKARWFVFTPHLLSYYETMSMEKKKGDIVINSDSDLENIIDTEKSKCNFFVVCGVSKKKFEIQAADQRTKNEWMSAIKQCIDIESDVTPLMVELSNRAERRAEKQHSRSLAEIKALEHEEFLKNQLKELENTRLALDQANIQAETEAALKEDERRRREELLLLKDESEKLLEREKQARGEEQKELENTRLALDQANLQTETEAALKEEEQRRREELLVLNAEYERLLEEERQAREEENTARTKQQEMLENERAKRLELERIKEEQDEILQNERTMRVGLEEMSKEQARELEEERERLRVLEEARKSAEEEVKAAHAKLEASVNESHAAASRVEEAKQKTRLMTGAAGLNRTKVLMQQRMITHRGTGAFVDEDFSKVPLYQLDADAPVPVNQSELPGEERAQILETNLVKPSQLREAFENQLGNN